MAQTLADAGLAPLRSAVGEAPADAALRLVYADALEEAGREAEAEALRTAAGRQQLLGKVGTPQKGELYVLRMPGGDGGYADEQEWRSSAMRIQEWWERQYPGSFLYVIHDDGDLRRLAELPPAALGAAGWVPATTAGRLEAENKKLREQLSEARAAAAEADDARRRLALHGIAWDDSEAEGR